MPTTARDWSEPYLEQARADLQTAWKFGDIPEQRGSTFCMLIQMVFEKLAKAAYARAGSSVPKKHQAVSRLFILLLRHSSGIELLQKYPNVQTFIEQLELAHPAIARDNYPQLEYPWQDQATGTVCYPERDLPLARRVRDPKDRIAVDCLRLASAIEKDLTLIVP